MPHHNAIRKDKTCQNCNHFVKNQFCSHCGQENIDIDKSFHHLFIHFFEDLTHYESAFWKTLKNLMLRPGFLTKEYLAGKRMSFLPPVKLYIFVSFITFLLLPVLPGNVDVKNSTGKEETKTYEKQTPHINKKITPALKPKQDAQIEPVTINIDSDTFLNLKYNKIKYHDAATLDSIHEQAKPAEKKGYWEFYFRKKLVEVTEKYTNKEIIEKFAESFVHNIPKSLFLYMPLFAFVLWLFQNKKKWFYFDHGIFTLHYFSFLLLSILILCGFNSLLSFLPQYDFLDFIENILSIVGVGYMFYYFFPAHHRLYDEKRSISFIKGFSLFFINMIAFVFILLLAALYTLLTIH